MKVMYGIMLVVISIATICCAGSPRTYENAIPITMDEYGEHLMHYFENKNDAIIYETISIYKNDAYTGMLDQLDGIVLFFFYGIKNDNGVRYTNFRKIVTDSKVERLIRIFITIDETDIASILEDQDADPGLNDVYWTLYLSSGDVKYIDYLLKIVMDHHNETENVNYYLTARSAMWSLSSNMQTFPSVREYVQNNTILSNDMKRYLINNDHNKIQDDTVRFINEQQQRGIW